MRKNWLLIGIGLLIAVLAIGAIACGDDDGNGNGNGNGDTGTVVGVRLLEFSVLPEPGSVAAGDVTFEASNEGAENHEFVIVRTDLAANALPTKDDGSVDEAQVEVIDRIAELESGGTGSTTVTLEAGSYVLICNLVIEQEGDDPDIHYALGMRLAFEVTE